MRLTTRTDYALRMMVFLGLKYPDFTTIQEIADRYRISKNHLMKITNDLAQDGWIESQRGRAGGIRLGKPADRIVIGQLVRATEEGTALVECFRATGNDCVLTPACSLAGALAEALDAYYAVLDRYTVADVIANRGKMAALLGLGSDARTPEREPETAG